jgi:hypothetical protein
MKTRYWTFGKLLLVYGLIDFGLDFGEMVRLSRLNQESGISFCTFPPHPPLAIFLLPALLLWVGARRWSYPLILFLGGVILYWTVKDLYRFFLAPFNIYEATGQFGFPGFWLGEGGVRVFPRLTAAVFLLGFSIRGLWAGWKEKSRGRDLNAEV